LSFDEFGVSLSLSLSLPPAPSLKLSEAEGARVPSQTEPQLDEFGVWKSDLSPIHVDRVKKALFRTVPPHSNTLLGVSCQAGVR